MTNETVSYISQGSEQVAEAVLEDSLFELDDETYLAVSHAFGRQYKDMLTPNAASTEQSHAIEGQRYAINTVLERYTKTLEGLSDAQIAAMMVSGYRSAYNNLLAEHGMEPEFADTALTDDEMHAITGIGRTATGLPVLYTTDNDKLFGRGTATSFCSSDLLLGASLPPLIVVGDRIGDRERVTVHESSHALWAVMAAEGMIPDSEEARAGIGSRSPLDVARDEAAAMQVAGQGKIIHPNVIKYLQEEGADPAFVDRYRASCSAYAEAMRGVEGIEQADSVLGFMKARSWEEFLGHVDRMTRLAQAAPHQALDTPPASLVPSGGVGGWGTV